MKKTVHLKRKWLPVALVPIMSLAVLSGCSSDDDPVMDTDTDTSTVVGDTDGNNIPDGFQPADASADVNPTDGIDDRFAPTSAETDTNNNGIDDSFEPALSMGEDADMDGIDDAALAALNAGGNGDGDGGDGDGNGDGDGGNGGGDGDGSDNIGSLGEVSIGNNNEGVADLSWDGSNLSGAITMSDSAGATSAALYNAIAGTNDEGQFLISMSGTAPNFTYPIMLSADQTAPITSALLSGSLLLQVETASGPIRSVQLLPPGGAVVATYTGLEKVADTTNSNGAAFLNFNKDTGAYSAYLNVNIDASDVDAAGNTVTISAAHVHSESAAGSILFPLADSGSGTMFKASGTMDADQLNVINTNNGWFNVHLNDGEPTGASFLTGQIVIP